MLMKRHSYTREDLLASSQGELFGPGRPQLPAPNMLMMDRIANITDEGGDFDKGFLEALSAVMVQHPLPYKSVGVGVTVALKTPGHLKQIKKNPGNIFKTYYVYTSQMKIRKFVDAGKDGHRQIPKISLTKS